VKPKLALLIVIAACLLWHAFIYIVLGST